MSHFQLINEETVRLKATDALYRIKNRLAASRKALEIVLMHEGATINGHLLNKLKKAVLPDWKLYLDTQYGWYQLEIGGPGFDTIRVNLAYKGQTTVIDKALVEAGFNPYLLDAERLVKYEGELETIEARVKRFNYALVELKDAYDGLGDLRFAFSDNHLPSIKDAQGRWI
jgi:hypothetical protein